jgi:pyruvate formate lyase activating enzyme
MKNHTSFKIGGNAEILARPTNTNELAQIWNACRENKIHTVLDTSGFATEDMAEEILPYVDLLLLDFKTFNPKTYFKLTRAKIERPLNTLRFAQILKIPTWVRFVLVPGLTDDMDDIREMATFLNRHENIEKIEVLPFHKHGEHKWDELEYKYELHNTMPPTPQQVQEVQDILAFTPRR